MEQTPEETETEQKAPSFDLPAEIGVGYVTNRTQVFRMFQRGLSPAETQEVLKALTHQMDQVETLKSENVDMKKRLDFIIGRTHDITRVCHDVINVASFKKDF